jgi:hypothetical protein
MMKSLNRNHASRSPDKHLSDDRHIIERYRNFEKLIIFALHKRG